MRTKKQAEKIGNKILGKLIDDYPELNFQNVLLDPNFDEECDEPVYCVNILNSEEDWDTTGIIDIHIEIEFRKGRKMKLRKS